MSRLQAVQDSWTDHFIGSSKEGMVKIKPHVGKKKKKDEAINCSFELLQLDFAHNPKTMKVTTLPSTLISEDLSTTLVFCFVVVFNLYYLLQYWTEPRASCMRGKHSINELSPAPTLGVLIVDAKGEPGKLSTFLMVPNTPELTR